MYSVHRWVVEHLLCEQEEEDKGVILLLTVSLTTEILGNRDRAVGRKEDF